MGATSRVNSRLIFAVSTAASEVLICALAVSTVAMAARLFCTALSRSCWLAACSFCQGLVSLDIEFGAALHCYGIGECGLRLCQLAFGLVEGCLKRPRVDLEKKLTLFDERAFLIALSLQVPCDLRPDVGIDEPVEGADPFAEDRNILLLHLNHLDIYRRARRCARDLVWPCPDDDAEHDQAKHSGTSDYKVAFRNTGHVDEKPRREDVSASSSKIEINARACFQGPVRRLCFCILHCSHEKYSVRRV